MLVFFSTDTATAAIYTLSLHDALPISRKCRTGTASSRGRPRLAHTASAASHPERTALSIDRKSTRLNSSHLGISYAVFCLKKKKIMRVTIDQMLDREHGPAVTPRRPPT